MSSRIGLKFANIRTQLSIDDRALCFTKACESEEVTIFNVQGVIGSRWLDDGITAQEMVPQIQNTKTDIVLRLNTPGGFITDALDIFDALVQHPMNVRADIVAEAWSAGTIITAAADETRIARGAKFGVHRAWAGMMVVGNSEEIAEQMKQVEANRKTLEKLDVEIAGILSERTGKPLKQIHDWMIGPDGVDGTEFVGQEAVDAGLVDGMISTPEPEPTLRNNAELRVRLQRQQLQLLQHRAGLKVA